MSDGAIPVQKSFTAKVAKDAEEKNSFTAKDAKGTIIIISFAVMLFFSFAGLASFAVRLFR